MLGGRSFLWKPGALHRRWRPAHSFWRKLRAGRPGAPAQPEFRSAVWSGLGPGKERTTVVRAGIGMYYDNNVFSNLLGDRVARLANGQFNAQANDPCASHGVVIFPGNVAQSAAGLCGQPIGNVATAIADLQTAFQAANAALTSSSPNPSYRGTGAQQPAGPAGAHLPDSALVADEHRVAETVLADHPVQRGLCAQRRHALSDRV